MFIKKKFSRKYLPRMVRNELCLVGIVVDAFRSKVELKFLIKDELLMSSELFYK